MLFKSAFDKANLDKSGIEVAERAHADGWRVLHVSPVEQGLTEKELMSVIAAGARPTLVCFDYIDFMYGLDYISLGGRQVRDADNRGVRLRYLANSRPMWTETALLNPAALEVYSFLELKTAGEQQERLLRHMIQTVAARALAEWGATELLRVCGRRPVIVLLIAREIERRLAEGTLARDELKAAYGGDLSVWLRKRLAGDELRIPEPATFWERRAPPDPMVAACAALVAAPNNPETLVAAAAAALGSTESNTDADFVVRQLTKMGWLEGSGSWLATPHDVVADEVFDQTVRDSDQIRECVLTAVLSLWVSEPRAIGRLATALRRWIGAASPSPAAVEKADSFVAEWLQAHAAPIGALLASGNPDLTGFALGSVLKGRPFSEPAMQCWDKLIAPWLVANQHRPEARHILYSGLREDSVAPRLVPHAAVWLEWNFREEVASYVLAPLLGRTDLAKEQAETVIGRALAWLAKFPLETETGFVLHPLLGRTDLAKEQAETVIGRALAWLAKFPLETAAGADGLGQGAGRDRHRAGAGLARQVPVGDRNRVCSWRKKPTRCWGGRTWPRSRPRPSSGGRWLGSPSSRWRQKPVCSSPAAGADGLGQGAGRDRGGQWLGKFPLETEAGFFTRCWGGRIWPRSRQDRGRALAWLAKFPLEKEARFLARCWGGRIWPRSRRDRHRAGAGLARQVPVGERSRVSFFPRCWGGRT